MPITYTDKQVAVDPQNPVDPIEKWKADDANEVKNVVNAHIADTANPHGVTKSQVGLGSVPNLSFSGSNTGDQDLSGLQPIDSDLTAIAALTPANDDFMQRKSGAWSNRTVSQVKTDLAISNIDNTADTAKPVSTAQQTALDLKTNLVNSAVALTDAATIDLTAIKHTLSTSSATRTFTISYTGDDITIEVTLSAITSIFTFPSGSLCMFNGDPSEDNTCTLVGTSGDKYMIAVKKIGSVYYVIAANFRQ